MAGRIFPDASGFLSMASIALKPIRPIAMAGPNPPIAITDPLAKIISKFYSPPFTPKGQLRFPFGIFLSLVEKFILAKPDSNLISIFVCVIVNYFSGQISGLRLP